MRRVIIELLRCTRCRRGRLLPEPDTQELVFGPLRCVECQATFPVAEGVADLLGERPDPSGLQRAWEQPWVARSYERYVRGLCQTALTRRQMDWDSEYLLYRSLLGGGDGAVLDLGCGTGLFARRLARDPDFGSVVGMDVSKPMIEEGVAQSREEGAPVDFVRCRAPALPFQDASLGGILQAGSLHWVPELGLALREIARALRPGGAYVLSTYLPSRRWKARLHARLGLHPRSEEELRQALTAAGLARVQRVLLPPWLVMKAEKEKG